MNATVYLWSNVPNGEIADNYPVYILDLIQDNGLMPSAAKQPTKDNASNQEKSAILFISALDCGAMSVKLPKTTPAKARKAAGYAVEDDLAVPVEACHIALGDYDDNNDLPIRIVDHGALKKLIDTIEQEQGYQITAVYRDMDLCHLDNLPALIKAPDNRQYLAVTGETGEINLLDQEMKDIIVPDLDLSSLKTVLLQDELKNTLHHSTPPRNSINLLQGSLRPKINLSTLWLMWRPPAFMAVAIVVIAFIMIVAQPVTLNRQAASLDQEANELMAENFPGVKSLPHLKQKLAAMQTTTTDPFLSLSSVLFLSIGAVDETAVSTLRYDAKRAGLYVTLEAGSYGAVQALSQELERRGAIMSEGASRQSGRYVVSDIVITSQ